MQKELVAIEFRYSINKEEEKEHRTRKITIGVYDSLEEAINKGNEALDYLSQHFEIRDKFKKIHLFGNPKKLVTNTSYPTKGIQFFATITTLNFDSLDVTTNEIFNQLKT